MSVRGLGVGELASVWVCMYPPVCVHACVCHHRMRPHSCLILRLLINVQNLQRLFPAALQKNLFNCHAPQTHPVSLLPPFPLAETPPVGRCTLRWQPKCQPALHMPASTVPAYSCHSPPGFSWPGLPKSVPATHPPPHSSVSTPSLSFPIHTPNLIPLVPALPLVSHKAVKHFRLPTRIHLSYHPHLGDLTLTAFL